MKTIHKFKLNLVCANRPIQVRIPKNAIVLTAQNQFEEIYVWAEVDSDNELETRVFEVFGTGHMMNEGIIRRYISTIQFAGGSLVFHVYERLS